jgi:hypothetical protein
MENRRYGHLNNGQDELRSAGGDRVRVKVHTVEEPSTVPAVNLFVKRLHQNLSGNEQSSNNLNQQDQQVRTDVANGSGIG